MKMIRTTLRIQKDLKDQVEKYAFEKKTTFQSIFNQALAEYVHKTAKKKAKRIVFKSQDLGAKLDNLTRDDFYDTP